MSNRNNTVIPDWFTLIGFVVTRKMVGSCVRRVLSVVCQCYPAVSQRACSPASGPKYKTAVHRHEGPCLLKAYHRHMCRLFIEKN